MKNSGSKDTVLLFVVLLLALGAVCYLCVIKKNLSNLNDVKNELAAVEQEKARNDAIIQQADTLDHQKTELIGSLGTLENKLLPDLNSAAINRKLYKHFDEANLQYIVSIENTPINYETVTLPDGRVSSDRVKWATYTIKVSGTDGFLLTHDEGDVLPSEIFYNQLSIPLGSTNVKNESAAQYGITDVNQIRSEEYVGYKEFVTALEGIQKDAPNYVKISAIQIEDMGQGFCEFTAAVDVFAYDLVNRKSDPVGHMPYMTWVGDTDIATGGLVGLPSYFVLSSPNYDVPDSSPLHNYYLSFVEYDFNVNRPFAAWNHWSYEWKQFDEIKGELAKMPPDLRMVELQYRMGMMSTEDYNRVMAAYQKAEEANQQKPDATRP